MSGFYAKERDQIASIETELGEVTQKFIANEEELNELGGSLNNLENCFARNENGVDEAFYRCSKMLRSKT